MVRDRHLIIVVGTFLIGCAVLASHSRGAAAEEVRCEGTRPTDLPQSAPASAAPSTTNDLPGCPKGGLLSGTDEPDQLEGKDGEDEIRGLGAADSILGGDGNDVIYGGPGSDSPLFGGDGDDVIWGGDGDEGEMDAGKGEDVLYGGDGSDFVVAGWDRQPDKLYCGKGKDEYYADKNDIVSSSCEKKVKILAFFGGDGAGSPSATASALPDSSGGVPRLGVVGMAGLAMAAVSLVVLLRLLRIS